MLLTVLNLSHAAVHVRGTAAHLEALFSRGSLCCGELLAVGDALRLEARVQLGQPL